MAGAPNTLPWARVRGRYGIDLGPKQAKTAVLGSFSVHKESGFNFQLLGLLFSVSTSKIGSRSDVAGSTGVFF